MDTTNFEDYQPVQSNSFTVTTETVQKPAPILKRGHLIIEGFPDEIVGELRRSLPYCKLRMRVDFEVIE